MKNFRRWISIVLCLLSLLEILAGCAKAPESDDKVYLTKGEFLSYYVYDNQMSSELFTQEEVNACEDYSAEAQIIAEWEYLTEEQATKNLDKPVTKEIVVTVCANAAFDLKTGDPSKIKDADMLADPQLMADAVASGFCELENGYFDGEEKLSLPEVEQIMDNALEFAAGIHYEPVPDHIEMDDEVATQNTEDYQAGDIIIDFGDEEDEEEEPTASNTAFSGAQEQPRAVLLGQSASDGARVVELDETETENEKKEFTLKMTTDYFQKKMGNPKIGQIIEIRNYQNAVSGMEKQNQIVCVLLDTTVEKDMIICTVRDATFEEAALHAKTIPNTEGFEKIVSSFKPLETNVFGWKLNFDTSKGYIDITAEKDFQVYKETGQKQDWMNARQNMTAKANFWMSNLSVTTNNLKSFASKRGKGFIKIAFDSGVSAEFSGSARYVPDSNRNAGLMAVAKRSRFTDAEGPGAKSIRIAKFEPGLGGPVSCEIGIYLEILLDGSIRFSTSVSQGGVQITTNNGKVSRQKLGVKDKDVEINVNLTANFILKTTLKLFTRIDIIEYDVKFVVDSHAKINIYKEEKLEEEDIYSDPFTIDRYTAEVPEAHSCLDVTISKRIEGEIGKRGVKLLRDLAADHLNFSKSLGEPKNWHFEDGQRVPECTRGKKKEVEKSEIGEVELETYKVNMADRTCQSVDLLAVPAESKKVMGTKNAVTVKSLDESICHAFYIPERHEIVIETAGGEGSTEIVVMAKKSSVWWKNTVEQKISVTVSKDSDLEVHELTEASLPQEEPIFVGVFLPVLPGVRV